MAETKGKVRVLILGGGFGGIYTALRLEKALQADEAEITLVSRDNYFLMTPLLFEAGSGILEPRHAVSPIRRLLPDTQFIEAQVQSVDFEKRVVLAKPTSDEAYEVPYDQLVIAVGGVTNTSLIPGAEN